MVDAGRATGWRSSASTTTSARSTTSPLARFSLTRYAPDGKTARLRREMIEIPGAQLPQARARQGRHRQVPRRAAGRAEGRLRRHHHRGELHPAPDAAARSAPLPRILRPGARGGAGDRRDQATTSTAAEGAQRHASARGPRAPRRALRESRRLCDQGQARGARPKMVLLGDIVGDDENAVAARGLARSCASPTRAAARASSRSAAETRKQVLARPRAHRRDRQAHQRVQDQRGRRDPARRASAIIPTASSGSTSSCRSRTSSSCSTR